MNILDVLRNAITNIWCACIAVVQTIVYFNYIIARANPDSKSFQAISSRPGICSGSVTCIGVSLTGSVDTNSPAVNLKQH